MNSTVAFHTLGCKLNFAETSAIGRQLKDAGFQKVEFETGADIVVINTCSVTANADKECKLIVRRALNKNPDTFIAVIGCYAQLKPDEIACIDGVDLVLGATEKFNLAAYLTDTLKKEKTEIHSCTIGDSDNFNVAYSHGDRKRAFLKIQDGCDYPCTYCTIPLARGSSRSSGISETISIANELISKGIKEIVLTGVNIGDYGITDTHSGKREDDFFELIKRLENINADVRFRISSIEPNLLKDEMIRFVSQSEKFVQHFHIPLQSGSNKILRLMKRRYRKELYEERVHLIKSLMPDCAIGADVISGFPGETDEDFLETFNFINSLDISYLHVFTYSERSNTEAALMKDKVPSSLKKKRTNMLRILSEKKRQAFYRTQQGKELSVLFEARSADGFLYGYSGNYIRIRHEYDQSVIDRPVKILFNEFTGGSFVEATLCETAV